MFQHYSTHFKSPIAGEYNVHVLIDNLSCYLIVQVVESTRFKDLKPKLDDVFGMFGVPESKTHDGGLPYYSED